jgi:hypothetical protein
LELPVAQKAAVDTSPDPALTYLAVFKSASSVQLVPLYNSCITNLLQEYNLINTKPSFCEPAVPPYVRLAVFIAPPDAQVPAVTPPGLTVLKVPLCRIVKD